MLVYQCETDEYIEMKPIGTLKYLGESFGVDGLTNGKEYAVVGIDEDFGDLRIVDDSEEDYLYSMANPRPQDGSSPGGKWEIVEDYTGELSKFIN